MWKWFSIIVLCASPISAQCPGGNCPIDIGDLPPIVQQGTDYGYVKPEGHLRSVVRIICPTQRGSAMGSGVYVNYNNVYVVITANHVIRDANKIFVYFVNSAEKVTVQGVVLATDTTFDCAVIGLYKHPVDGEEIAATMAYKDDLVTFTTDLLQNAGFGGDGILCAGSGKLLKMSGPAGGLPADWMEIATQARFGDSGGPIFLPNGKVCGILWGKDSRMIIAVCPGRVHIVLAEARQKIDIQPAQIVQPRPLPRTPKKLVPVLPLKPPVLPWRDKIENEIDGIKRHIEKQPPHVQPSPPVVQPRPNIDVDVVPIQPVTPDEVANVRKRVDIHVALPIILGLCLIGMAGGFAYQWKKTYSI